MADDTLEHQAAPDAGKVKRAPPTIDLGATEMSATTKPAAEAKGEAKSEAKSEPNVEAKPEAASAAVSPPTSQSNSRPISAWVIAPFSGAVAAALVILVGWMLGWPAVQAPPSPEVGLGLGNERIIGAELRQTATQPNTPGPVTPPQFPGVLINVGTFTPNAAGGRTNEIRFNGADISQAIAPLGANGFNIPSLLSVHETAPYFYSGLATTLDQVLDGSQDGNGGVRHHFVPSAAQRADLIQFLRSIDDRTPIFP